MNRRYLLKSAAALAAYPWLTSCGGVTPTVADGNRIERIGIQLYTVRDQMASDVPRTLQAIAAIGYDEVEFAGYFDHTPAEISRLLASTGLTSPSSHVALADIRNTPERLIETAKAIGNRYVVLAWLAPDDRQTLDDYRAHIELVNNFAEQCRDAGLQFAWHNHDFEFIELEGQRPIDMLLEQTDAGLVQVEVDLYWIAKARVDPLTYFTRHPGRFPLCHVKDMAADSSMADVGDGTIDFPGIFANSELAGLEHYFVERDDSQRPLETAARSYAAVSEMTF